MRAVIFALALLPAYALAETQAPPSSASHVLLDVKTWTRSTGIADIGFKIKNDNEFAIKDPTIQCNFYGNSGTVVERLRKTLFEKINAKSSKHIRSFVMGFSGDQAATINCAVIDLTESR